MLCLLITFLTFYGAIEARPQQSPFSTRIVNGTDANDGQFPYAASLKFVGSGHACAASILTPYWLLTAAQCCLTGYPLQVYVGSVYLDKGGKSYPIRKYVIHGEYDPSSFQKNDICLINVGIPLEYNDRVKPISLPLKDFVIPANASMTFVGWGDTDPTDGLSTSNQLQILGGDQPLTNDECSKKIGMELYDGQLCALDRIDGGACGGDSGGPLSYKNVQVGISSWEYATCGLGGMPDIFTRTSFYIDWINEILGSSAMDLSFSSSTEI